MVNYFYELMTKKPLLVVIAGPTAVGKTSMSIEVAQYLNCPIISCDSRQFYKELDIGVAKPSKEDLNLIPHYFIGNKSIHELYSAGQFENDVLNWLDSYFKENNIVIMTGGSGMYIDAVCNGLDELPKNEKIRSKLNEAFKAKGLVHLQEKLKKLDPKHFNKVDINNPQRVIRALEVCMSTNKPYSSFLTNKKKIRPFKIVKILLHLNKENLHNNIEKRTDQMIINGLLDEVRSLYQHRDCNALNTVGYKEIFKYFNEEINYNEAIEEIKSNTKKYAKRQMTWFKRDKDYSWVDNNDRNLAFEEITSIINDN